jgi:hypothetical protein
MFVCSYFLSGKLHSDAVLPRLRHPAPRTFQSYRVQTRDQVWLVEVYGPGCARSIGHCYMLKVVGVPLGCEIISVLVLASIHRNPLRYYISC